MKLSAVRGAYCFSTPIPNVNDAGGGEVVPPIA